MDTTEHVTLVDLVRLESKILHMDENLCQLLKEVRLVKEDLIEGREKNLRSLLRIEHLEQETTTLKKEQDSIKISLQGNITSKVLKQWILCASSIMTAVTVLLGMLLKFVS